MKLGGGLSEVSGGVKGVRRSMDLIIAHCIHIWHSRRIQILNKWVNNISFGFSQEVNSSFELSFRLHKTFEFNKKLLTFTIGILETWATHTRPCALVPQLPLFSGPRRETFIPQRVWVFCGNCSALKCQDNWGDTSTNNLCKGQRWGISTVQATRTFRIVVRVHIYQITSRGEESRPSHSP